MFLMVVVNLIGMVSTHSRPKAAGFFYIFDFVITLRFQHTAARRRLASPMRSSKLTTPVSTHSRPKAAGVLRPRICPKIQCFNTQPPEGGWDFYRQNPIYNEKFQHTAARRRLGHRVPRGVDSVLVSTHSRPKAAGGKQSQKMRNRHGFNTQPPEGGWAQAGRYRLPTV